MRFNYTVLERNKTPTLTNKQRNECNAMQKISTHLNSKRYQCVFGFRN